MEANKLWYGVVESRADPLKLGRCKVRVIGIHTEDTNMLPTVDLPWAVPMHSITSAALTGIGGSPFGPLEGTWVVLMFRDEGTYQEPLMIGALQGIPMSVVQTFKPYNGDVGQFLGTQGLDDAVYSEDDDVWTDRSGKPVMDGQGNPITKTNVLKQTDGTLDRTTTQSTEDYQLGKIASKYEAVSASTINDYNGKASGDFGGASYGKYQLASYMNGNGQTSTKALNSPVLEFLESSGYKSQFTGLQPGTPMFDKKWREQAKDPAFAEAQDRYIQEEYYVPASNSLRAKDVDLTRRGVAVQEAIYSTSVQYGVSGCSRVVGRALSGKDINAMTDAEIVSAIQDDKLRNIRSDFKSSPSLWGGLENRMKNEKLDLVKLAGSDTVYTPDEILAYRKANGETETVFVEGAPVERVRTDIQLTPIPASNVMIPSMPKNNGKPGFSDPNERYPRAKNVRENDGSRLGRNEKTNDTILKAKKNSLIKNCRTANNVRFDEPESKYAAAYPLNHVQETESGHVMEFDDTPDAERIHIYHRKGSFVEFHPDGTVVYKSAKDNFDITVNDKNVYVGGTCNVTILGDANFYAKGKMNLESDGDMTIKTRSNLRIGSMGTTHIESNSPMHLGSSSNTHIAGSNVFANCTWRSSSVKAGNYQVDKLSVEMYDDINTTEVPEELEASTISELQSNGTIPQPGTVPVELPESYVNDLPKAAADTSTPIIDERMDNQDPISSNFTVADLSSNAVLTNHEVVEQNGLTREQIINNMSETAKNVVEPIRSTYGDEFIITSGFRRGESKSQHNKGQAVDIQFPGLTKEEAATRAAEIAATLPNGYDQMIVEYHGSTGPVFHISYNAGGNRNQKLSTPNPATGKYFSGFRDQNMIPVYR